MGAFIMYKQAEAHYVKQLHIKTNHAKGHGVFVDPTTNAPCPFCVRV